MPTEQDETVKIVVEVVDKFSKPLNDLKKEMESFADKGGKSATAVKTKFDELRTSVAGAASNIVNLLTPGLRSLGFAFTTLAATVGVAVGALKGFAGHIETLSRLNRETGLAIDKMREMEAVGRRLGLTVGEVQQGFRGFAEAMHSVELGTEVFGELAMRGLPNLANALRAAKGDRDKQIQLYMEQLDRTKDPQHRRELLRIGKLPEAYADLSKEERNKYIEEYHKTGGGPVTADTVAKAKEFNDELWKTGNRFDEMTKKLAEEGGLKTLAVTLDEVSTAAFKASEALLGVADKLTAGSKPPASWDEWWKNIQQHPGTLFGLTSSTGSGESKTKDLIKVGTSEGVVDAFKQMQLDTTGGPGGGAPGTFGGASLIRASLGGGGGGYGGGRRGSGGGGPAGDANPMGALAGFDRSRFAAELEAKPWLKEKILGIASGENKDPQANLAVIESMMNRAAARGTSLEQAAKLVGEGNGGYYAGYDPGALRRPAIRKMIEGNLRAALGGSNVSNYATDNSSGGLAEREKRSGKFRLQFEHGGESFFSPGTAGGAHGPASRERYEAWRKSIPMPQPRPQSDEHPAKARERLMDTSLRANQFAKVEGNASVSIDLNGFPRGTKIASSSSGIFSDVELHRGNTLPLASESA
jgi:hypothetical protein